MYVTRFCFVFLVDLWVTAPDVFVPALTPHCCLFRARLFPPPVVPLALSSRLRRDAVCSPPLAHNSWAHHHQRSQRLHQHQHEPHQHHQCHQLHHHRPSRGAASPWDGGAAAELHLLDGATVDVDGVISRGGGGGGGGGNGRHLTAHGAGDERGNSGQIGGRDGDNGVGGGAGAGGGVGGGGSGSSGGGRVGGVGVDVREPVSIHWGKSASNARGEPRWNTREREERGVARRAGGSGSTGRGRILSGEGRDRGDGGYAEPSNARQEEEEDEGERYSSRTAAALSGVEKEGMGGGGGTSWTSSRESRRGGRDDEFFGQEEERDPSLAPAESLYIAGRKRFRRDPHGRGGEIFRGSAVSSGAGAGGNRSGGRGGGGSGGRSSSSGGGTGGQREGCIDGRGDDERPSRGSDSAESAMSFTGGPPWSGRLAGALQPPVSVGGDGVGEAVADSSPERDRRRPSIRRRVDTDRDDDGRTACR